MKLQFDAVDEMERIRAIAFEAARRGDYAAAGKAVDALEKEFKERSKWLELLGPHDDLHEIYLQIVDAKVCIELEKRDDVHQALVHLKEVLQHVRDHESFSMTNLY
jgi:hypothetical protein